MKTSLALAIILTVVSVIFLPSLAGKFYGTSDMRDIHIPLELFFQQELRAGRLPAWNPDMAWGFPVIASAQIGFFYPPLLIGRLLFPISFYLPAVVWLHFVALGLGLFAFLKSLRVSTGAALLGNLAFTLGQFVWQHITHLNIILAIAWWPWQMLAARRLAHSRHSHLSAEAWAKADVIRRLASLALLVGIPFLAGQIQVPLLMAAVTSVYFAIERWQYHRSLPKTLVAVCLLAVLTVGIGAAQLLPTLELARHSTRGPSGDFDITRANQHSFPWYHLPTFLFPRFFGNDDTYWGKRLEIEYGVFIGTFPLVLGLWQLFCRKKGGQTSHANSQMFFVWLAVISFLLALGSHSPFRLIGLEPSLWIFSAPARWLLFTTFSLAVLSAHGFDRIAATKRHLTRYTGWLAVGVVLAVAAVNIILFVSPVTARAAMVTALSVIPNQYLNQPPLYYVQKMDMLVTSMRTSGVSLLSPATLPPLLLIVGTPFLLSRRRGHLVLAVATVVELVVFAAGTSPRVPWQQILAVPETVDALPSDVRHGQSRILSLQPSNDSGAFLTNPNSRADAAMRQLQSNLLVPLRHSQYDLASIEWPASLDLAASARLLDRIKNPPNGLLVDATLARQHNVSTLLVAGTLPAPPDPFKLAAKQDDLAIYAADAAPRAQLVGANGLPLPGAEAIYENVDASHARVDADAPTEATLIVRDTFYPGWQATVDGQPARIHVAEQTFRAIPVPAGRHVVEMMYRPAWLYRGLVISIATGVLLLFAIVVSPRFAGKLRI